MADLSGIAALPHAGLAGAFVLQDGAIFFRVWAPQSRRVELILEPQDVRIALRSVQNGFFEATVRDTRAGQLYYYSLDGGDSLPDPASRFQPKGLKGPSEVIDPISFRWSDQDWPGLKMQSQVLYEFHVGTFTEEGTYEAAMGRLPRLSELGITALEMMPVSAFEGRYGWGYDGVFPYAPFNAYGRPEQLASFVNAAHKAGIGVILDVVYNHLGPIGNVLPQFSKHYSSATQKTDWGPAINFDGEQSRAVRDYFCENAVQWIRDYHFDGLRLDATQDMHDHSAKHILAELVERSREAAGKRNIVIIGENEPQRSFYLRRPAEGGYGLDGLWNDDFHHSAMVALTGQSDAYYSDYKGHPQEFISSAKYGYLYQGQWYVWQKKNRGVPALDIPKPAFVNFIQNHDQIANSVAGDRIHELTIPARLRAMTALLLLAPGTPMLFQGQEYAAQSPFLFFADHCGELAEQVRAGRRAFLKQWRSMQDRDLDQFLADPCSEETFRRCKLSHGEEPESQQWFRLHADLLRLRREDPVIAAQARWGLDGAVLGSGAFLLRFFSDDGRNDRLLLLNFSLELELAPLPEPLAAPPVERIWKLSWSSEDPAYGGSGVAEVLEDGAWHIAGNSASLLVPQPISRPGAHSGSTIDRQIKR